jgi:DnaJ-class molecular chaperone
MGGGGHDPFDIFSAFFGGGGGGGGGGRRGGGRQQKQQMPPVKIDLPVTLKDLYVGRIVQVLLARRRALIGSIHFQVAHEKTVLCPKCRGTGSDNPDDV